MLESEVKKEIINKFKRHEKDTGSPEVQIALLTKRIEALNEHFKKHRKDFNSRRGFLKLIGRRRKLLRYLQQTDPEKYIKVISELNLRK
ncbi:MAG: 30S ribosomal protein S15 [Candidatus Omnitrophica bacterium]|nr:30S ribosomal protein S15 [Candidatus Omnitrophota bacterium]MCM8806657.1 30S ribosomal protein S15 [Candidatus Omnitrophota bacterium]